MEGRGEVRGGNVESTSEMGLILHIQYADSNVDETGKQRKVRTLHQRVS